jgi:hypothetical protein
MPARMNRQPLRRLTVMNYPAEPSPPPVTIARTILEAMPMLESNSDTVVESSRLDSTVTHEG